jgi:hypothetical protein
MSVEPQESEVRVLLGLKPIPRIIVGAFLFAEGTYDAIMCWSVGIAEMLFLIIVVSGALAVYSGYTDLRDLRSLRAQKEIVARCEADLLREIIAAKSVGESAISLLEGKGITDTRIRQRLLRQAQEKMDQAARDDTGMGRTT